MKDFNEWSELEVYEHLGQPHTEKIRSLTGAGPGPHAPAKIVEAIQYANLDENLLTGNVRIIDFGEAFFLNDPRREFLGTPAAYLAPEMLFGRSASAASDVWALGCLTFEVLALRPFICVFFGSFEEALSEVVQTLGPLPKAWQHSYHNKTLESKLEPGQKDPWFDSSDLRHPLESLIGKVKPQLTDKEITSLLGLLKGALQYEPTERLSAKQIATHSWFKV